jgi:hypothetical protein
MPDLSYRIEGAEPVPFAATPQIAFKLRLTADARSEDVSIQTVALRAQLRIEPAKRTYTPDEHEGLLDLFGEPHRWGQAQKSMLWTHSSLIVPPFSGTTLVDLHVACSYDFNIAATKYFYSLKAGEIPLCFLFSGTIFYETQDQLLQVAQIPWDKEANYRLTRSTWRQLMDHYYPNTSWLCLRSDVFDRLYCYKTASGLPTWEQALERLLPPARPGASS